MRVSVVLPTKNGGSTLAKTLSCIQSQRCDYDVEIIVVDSGSKDHTLDIAKKYGALVRQIPSRSFTHGGSRNLGASLSSAPYVVFCNQDAIPANGDWLTNLLAPLQEKTTGASYSRQVAFTESPLYERMFLSQHYPPESKRHTCESLRNRGPMEVVLFSTVSGALRKEVWKKFKFRDDMIMSEDQELACRLLLSGHTIAYEANSVVYHSNSYSLFDAFARYFDSGWSMTCVPWLRVRNVAKSRDYIMQQSSGILLAQNAKFTEKLSSLSYLLAKVSGFQIGQLASQLPETIRLRLSYTRRKILGTPVEPNS